MGDTRSASPQELRLLEDHNDRIAPQETPQAPGVSRDDPRNTDGMLSFRGRFRQI